MKKNSNKIPDLSEFITLFIAGITIWAFLLTYFNEAGLLKYFKISTRFIKLDIHIFAMSWRIFLAIIIVGSICATYYYLLNRYASKNIKTKNFVRLFCWFLFFLHLLFVFFTFFYIIFLWIDSLYINIYFLLFLFTLSFIFNTFFLWVIKEDNYFKLIVFILIITFIIGGMEASYINGNNFARNKDEYYIINGDSASVVVLENSEFILWSTYDKYNSTLDNSFKITYFSSDSSITLEMVELGPIKQKQ